MVKIHWFDGRSSYAPISGRNGVGMGGRKTYNKQSTVEAAMAHEPGVKPALKPYAQLILARAKGLHTSAQLNDAAFGRASRTRVYMDEGELDWGVHLEVDTSVEVPGVEGATGGSGLVAAMSVEFGHTGMGYGPIPFQVRGQRYPGKYILHRAAGISPRRGFG